GGSAATKKGRVAPSLRARSADVVGEIMIFRSSITVYYTRHLPSMQDTTTDRVIARVDDARPGRREPNDRGAPGL
ncbi:MAG: hypothetical protein NZ518_11980, partial [Dehalococcoidia bacterium]|nr:hypothetical protein [Dehalococcoidia bacterium]